MNKYLLIIAIILIAIFVLYPSLSYGFLDWLFDAISGIKDALGQLELLQAIHDFQSIQSEIAEFESDFREAQRLVTDGYGIYHRWDYFTTGIKNQNLDGIVSTFFKGNVNPEYDKILNQLYGQYGNIRANQEYATTASNLQKIIGVPITNEYSGNDPDTAVAINHLISATDNLNQAGNMASYEGYFAGKMESWIRDSLSAVNSKNTSSEALLKVLINYNILMIDFWKGQYAFNEAQMRYNFSMSFQNAKKYTNIVNQNRDTSDSGSLLFDEYFNYNQP